MAGVIQTTWTLLRNTYTLRLRMAETVNGFTSLSFRALSTGGLKVDGLASKIQSYVRKQEKVCQPDQIYVCDGSEEENEAILNKLQHDGRIQKLPKYDNCYYARTSPADVARVEKQTFVCTEKKLDTVPTPREGVVSKLGNWKSVADMDRELDLKFTGSMKGRTMYVIPFSMGPIGSPLSKIGIQLTDSEYVVASMRIMARIGKAVLDILQDDDFVQCLHSVGVPLLPGEDDVMWPCNPKQIAVAHFPERNEIKSFGSGYGGNSLLGKKCFALRIANTLAKKEGWLAEHMLIVGLTNPEGKKRYIAAAFPSACGKTNLAMLTPTMPGWKVECVGDDIAWMKIGKDGRFRAINPENGFFGVAPGTSNSSNPSAMETIFKNTIFTNTARTSDGGVYWEGMEDPAPGVSITSWMGVEHWEKLPAEERKRKLASHANARFCSPVNQYPHLDPNWEDSEGVPIDAILFGGRRPTTIPLVYESFDWKHGVFVGTGMKSESTAAAVDVKTKTIMHDPFAMRPFFGYNFTQYLEHWLSMESIPGIQLPKIFHVNWFRKDDKGKYVWPGFGDNLRVLDWVLRRCDGEDCAKKTPLGYVPSSNAINLEGLKEGDMRKEWLFKMSMEELLIDLEETEVYLNMQLPGQLPGPLVKEMAALRQRIINM